MNKMNKKSDQVYYNNKITTPVIQCRHLVVLSYLLRRTEQLTIL